MVFRLFRIQEIFFASGTYKRRGRLQIRVHWRRRRRLATNVRLGPHQREEFQLLKGYKYQDKRQRIGLVRYVQTLNPKDFFHKGIIRAQSDISFKKQQRTVRLIIGVSDIPVRRRNGGKTGSIELEGVILVTA